MRFDLTVSEFARDMFLKRDLVVYDADTWRPYCHLRDFARAIMRVLDFPAASVSRQVFNTGGDENNHTKRSIVEIIKKSLPEAHISYQQHGSDPRNYKVDFSKIRKTLHFLPSMTVPQGVAELLDALRRGVFHDADSRPNFHGNRQIPILDAELK